MSEPANPWGNLLTRSDPTAYREIKFVPSETAGPISWYRPHLDRVKSTPDSGRKTTASTCNQQALATQPSVLTCSVAGLTGCLGSSFQTNSITANSMLEGLSAERKTGLPIRIGLDSSDDQSMSCMFSTLLHTGSA